jgi:CHASE2 domain-containing sensor protein
VNLSTVRQHKFFRPAAGAALAVLVGLVLWTPLGDAWTSGSYDYLFRFSTYSATNQVVLVLMDNEAYSELGQSRGVPWDRAIHTKLLNKLADDGVALVVLDTRFSKPNATTDAAMAEAFHRLPNAVLAAGQSKPEHPGIESARALPPQEIFLNSSRNNWGVAWLNPEKDGIVRHHWPFPDPGPYPSLPWTAAKSMGAHLDATPSQKWIRYYGFEKTWVSFSYHLALQQNPGYFRGKIVFIGNKPRTPLFDSEEDEFQAPMSETVGGVEILVTEFLNLMNHDWLRRMPDPVEALLLIFSGTVLGLSLCAWQRRWRTLMLAFIAAVVFLYAGILLSEFSNYWFPWLIVIGGQLPCALAWALAVPKKVSVAEKTMVMARDTIVLSFPDDESPDAPDFELFNPPVGQGAYGKVWIVRNAIGQWQALKAIYQSKFGDNTRPYEAEFHGLQKYKPVSEKHPGLLRIEMVSKMKSEGYFYYVMELGDAQVEGWEKNPPSYKPRDLDNMRKQAPGRRLPVAECVRVLTILADALDFLHRQGLIHRDIKPSNVIFVNNRPKLADIGLVADIRPEDYNNTLVGTPGYMPLHPEKPGTVQADIYALGMVLYVISSGKDPAFFPEISATLMERTGNEEFIRLDAIILKACQPDTAQRYQTTAQMLKDLQALAKTN